MKNLKIKKILLSLSLATSLVLITTGCEKKETKKQVKSSEIEDVSTTDNKQEEIKQQQEQEHQETFDNFEQDKEEINTLIANNNLDLAKQKATNIFINATDFIFYDKEIKGITFDELKEEAKKTTFQNLSIIDQKICTFAPDYKDNLETKYTVVKDFITDKYYNSLDKIKELIGEEKYDAIKEFKDDLKDNAKDLGNKAKQKTKEWYQNFKEKNQ